jgi:hypothetical protein
MKNGVFWDVTLHSLAKITDVSEEYPASIFIYSACCVLALFSSLKGGGSMFL